MSDERCENCRFFQAGDKECHRYPPQVFFDESSNFEESWPKVLPTEWCGEWQASEKVATPSRTCSVTGQPILIDAFDVGILLGMKSYRVKRLARQGVLPHVMLPNDEPRFIADELRAWIEQHRHKAEGAVDADSQT